LYKEHDLHVTRYHHMARVSSGNFHIKLLISGEDPFFVQRA